MYLSLNLTPVHKLSLKSKGNEAPRPGCKPKLEVNCELIPQIWLVDWSVLPGSTKMLIKEHVVLCEIMFWK